MSSTATSVNDSGQLSGTFMDPERIVRYFELKSGDHVAEFGAGHGYFVIAMAKAVGGDGKVYAIDIQKSTLDIIRARAKIDHLLNIETVWSDLEVLGGSRIKDGFIEFVLISNVLFQADNKAVMLEEAYRVLREGGRMSVIEWADDKETTLGPPPSMRLGKESVKSLAQQAGFKSEKEFEAGTHHYGLLFKKA